MTRGRRSAAIAALVLTGSTAAAFAAETGPIAEPLGRTRSVRATVQDDTPARAYEPPTLLVDPRDPGTVVAGTIELTTGTCRLLRSTNGGASWALLDKTPSPADFPQCFRGGVYGYLNETPMAFGSDGALYWGINGLHPTRVDRDVSVLVARSTDLGDTWTSTLVSDGRKADVDPAFVSRPVTALAVHTAPGRDDVVYVGWQTFPPTGPRLVKVAVSTDGGKTFGTPKLPYDDATSQRLGGPGGLEGLPPTMRVAADGTLYILYPGRSPSDPTIPHRLYMARSTDQGQTFTVTEIGQVLEANTTPTFQWSPEGGADGTLHAVWEDRQEGPIGARDIFYAKSTDAGATWSRPKLINDDDPSKRFSQVNPNMSIAPNGRIDLVWWDFRDGAGLYATDVYYTYSTDQGATWAKNFRFTDRSIDRKIGTWSNNFDYRAPPAIVSLDQTALISWDDTRLSDGTTTTQDVFTASVQLAEVPSDDSALPFVVAGAVGFVAAGAVLVAVAMAGRRKASAPASA